MDESSFSFTFMEDEYAPGMLAAVYPEGMVDLPGGGSITLSFRSYGRDGEVIAEDVQSYDTETLYNAYDYFRAGVDAYTYSVDVSVTGADGCV